jgi:hypothetical protein
MIPKPRNAETNKGRWRRNEILATNAAGTEVRNIANIVTVINFVVKMRGFLGFGGLIDHNEYAVLRYRDTSKFSSCNRYIGYERRAIMRFF